MGKIRIKTLGSEETEKKQAEKASVRREEKKHKKAAQKTQVKGVGLKGGERIAVVEGTQIKPEAKALLEKTPEELAKKTKAKKKAVKTRSKRYQALRKLIDIQKSYPIPEAVDLVKKTANTKFDASVEAHVNLKPEVFTKEKTSLTATVNLPYGTGKKRIIAVVNDAVLKNIEAGKINFDVLIAHPSFMPKLAKFARILGPRGLMPNPKKGTISDDPEKRAKELEGGDTAWKTEPGNPIVHLSIGKASFTDKQLQENLIALIKSVGSNQIQKLTLSSTMGPGIKVNLTSL